MAVQISGNDITVPRDGTFSRNVSIAGTLTYEDVTNVDSIGLVTARNGIEVGASPGVAASISVDGNMIVSGISTFGGDINVVSDINLSDWIVHTGDLDSKFGFTAADTFAVETGGSERARITSGGQVLIGNTADPSDYNSGADDLIIGSHSSASGITILSPTNNGGFIMFSDNNGGGTNAYRGQIEYGHTDDMMRFMTASSERIRFGSSGQIGIAGANYGTDGQVLTSKGSGAAVQWASASSASSGTYTSFGTGNYVDITTTSTNIVKYDIMFTGVSCGGGTDWQFQLGDSGGIEASGYEVVACYRSHNSSNNTNNRSDGFRWHGTGDSSFQMDGKFSLTRIHNNKWFGEGQLVRTEAGSTLYDMWGTKELSAALTTIHISASSDDSEVFDAGHFKVIEYTGTV